MMPLAKDAKERKVLLLLIFIKMVDSAGIEGAAAAPISLHFITPDM